jgi:hypothetical protein
MGRRISSGIAPGGIGRLAIDQNTVRTVETNANLTISADGSGTIQVAKAIEVDGNLSLKNQSDLRLHELTVNGSASVGIQAAAAMSADYTITLPNAVAAANGYVLSSDTNGVTQWASPRPYTYSVVSTSFSAVSDNAYFVNTSSGGVTATLPASPSTGDSIRFFDVAKTFDTNNLTIARNGELIQGDAANMTVNSESAAFELVYSNSTYGWRIFSI